jgi:hypothetical protein
MNSYDPLILTAYLLCLAYFIYKIINAFNDEFTIEQLKANNEKDNADPVEKEGGLKQELESQNLQDALDISFGFDKRYEFDKLKELSISINNKSSDCSIYVDWDCSAIIGAGVGDLEKSRRITRLMPGTTLDLFQDQVFSSVAPKTTLKEKIAAEDMLQRKGERKADKLEKDSPQNLEIEIAKPLFDLTKPKPDAKPEVKKRHERFMERKQKLAFSLDLVLRLVGPGQSLGGDRLRIRCKFILTKLPWTSGLPWNPKK